MAKMPRCASSGRPSGLSRSAENTGSASMRGKQLQTIWARRSTSAAIMQLPMTARSREVIKLLIPGKRKGSPRGPCGQRMPQVGRRSHTGPRDGLAPADPDGKPVMGVDGCKTVLVGQIVAGEDRPAAAVRRLLQETLDGPALSGGGGENFGHGLAVLHPVFGAKRLGGGPDQA